MEGIQINGQLFTAEDVDTITPRLFPHLSESTCKEIRHFLNDWWSKRDFIEVQTSGSTGTPKTIRLPKKTVATSAEKTISFFELQAGQPVLLCLPCRYIAGMLMLVRAIRKNLNIISVEPNLRPLKKLPSPVGFAAMIPAQVIAALRHADEKEKLCQISQVLIGGAPIDPELEKQLATMPNRFFHSYGMTETATHVALRKIGQEEHYTALDGIRFSLDERACLVIEAEHLPNSIVTNDMVELHGHNRFSWLGRFDNAIISGGIKHIPEQLEIKIKPLIDQVFFITAIPDPLLGNRLALVIEDDVWCNERTDQLKAALSNVLSTHEMPKEIRFLKTFHRTETGKIMRTLTPKSMK